MGRERFQVVLPFLKPEVATRFKLKHNTELLVQAQAVSAMHIPLTLTGLPDT